MDGISMGSIVLDGYDWMVINGWYIIQAPEEPRVCGKYFTPKTQTPSGVPYLR